MAQKYNLSKPLGDKEILAIVASDAKGYLDELDVVSIQPHFKRDGSLSPFNPGKIRKLFIERAPPGTLVRDGVVNESEIRNIIADMNDLGSTGPAIFISTLDNPVAPNVSGKHSGTVFIIRGNHQINLREALSILAFLPEEIVTISKDRTFAEVENLFSASKVRYSIRMWQETDKIGKLKSRGIKPIYDIEDVGVQMVASSFSSVCRDFAKSGSLSNAGILFRGATILGALNGGQWQPNIVGFIEPAIYSKVI